MPTLVFQLCFECVKQTHFYSFHRKDQTSDMTGLHHFKFLKEKEQHLHTLFQHDPGAQKRKIKKIIIISKTCHTTSSQNKLEVQQICSQTQFQSLHCLCSFRKQHPEQLEYTMSTQSFSLFPFTFMCLTASNTIG